MAAAVPDHVVAVTAVVGGAAPPAAFIVILLIVGRMCTADVDTDAGPTPRQCKTSSTPSREFVRSRRMTVRRQEEEEVWQFFSPLLPPPPSLFLLVFLQLPPVL